ncbi:VOC family protein [Pseudorhodobacter sp.]|uniref:VOC family protein n=1 Tax=Pseudorhodobacter sp. TaxID=1934400 RepID=UPI0026478F15|nr:VOC family protein [Pseudorhodobacter sp.]MDN5786697.1 VOC family protein [Pseudorhodobacter sp.]
MTVLRIVANLSSPDPSTLARFYSDLFGLDLPLDMGWITFLETDAQQKVELHIASEGGSGTELPVISIEVDDLDAVLVRAKSLDSPPVYGPVTEPWGVRRFYLRDPAGTLINILSHA